MKLLGAELFTIKIFGYIIILIFLKNISLYEIDTN